MGGGTWGKILKFPAPQVRQGNWSPVQWYQPEILDALYRISEFKNLVRMETKYPVGPAGQRILEAFEKSSQAESDTTVFYSSGSAARFQMLADPEQPMKIQKGKKSQAKIYFGQKSYLLACQSIDTQSGIMTALYSEEPAFGASWIPVRVTTPEEAKVICAWLNSTPAILQFLNIRSRKLTWPKYSLEHLRSLLIPDLSKTNWEPLLDAFEQAKEQNLGRLRNIPTNPARRILDQAAAKILGIPEEEIFHWGSLLAKEPTISKKMADLENKKENSQ